MSRAIQILDIENHNKRDRTFDLLKLYAMLSVVLDHTLQHWIGGNIQSTYMYNWIFLSQMPIFMFVSGYFVISGIKQEWTSQKIVDTFFKKVCTLIIPFIQYGIISGLLHGKSIVARIILYPDYSLWFLWALFWMQLFMAISQYLCNRLLKGKTARFIASIICYIVLLACVGILYIKFPDFFDSKLIIFYSVFFLFGYLYSFCEKRVSIMTSEKYRIICILLMLSLIVVVMLRHPSVINESETVPNLIERVIGSAASIILMMNICHFACKIKIVEKVAAFGTLSLEMYYIHLLLLKIPLINDKVPNGSTFIIKYCGLVILALIVIFMIKSIWLLDLLFFGKMPRKSERKKLL